MLRYAALAFSLLTAVAASFANGGLGFPSSVSHRFVSSESQSGDIAYVQTGSWTATSSAGWLSIDSGTGSGAGSIIYSVEANQTGHPRIAAIQVGDRAFELIQTPATSSRIYGIGENELAELTGDGNPASINSMQVFWSEARDAQTHLVGTLILNTDGKLWGKGSYWSAYDETGEHGFRLLQQDVRSISAGSNLYLFEKEDGSLWAAEDSDEPVHLADHVVSYEAGYFSYSYLTNTGEFRAYSSFGNSDGKLGSHPNVPGAIDEPVLLATDATSGTVGAFNSSYVTQDGDLALRGSGLGGLFKGAIEGNWFSNQPDPVVVLHGVESAKLDSYDRMLVELKDGHLYNFEAGDFTSRPISNVQAYSVEPWLDRTSKWARNQSGQFYQWGWQEFGEFGIGHWYSHLEHPLLVGEGISNYTRSNGMGMRINDAGDVAFAGKDLLEINGPRLGSMPHPHLRSDLRMAYSDGQTSAFLAEDGELYILGRQLAPVFPTGPKGIHLEPEKLREGVRKVVPLRGSDGLALFVLEDPGAASVLGRMGLSRWAGEDVLKFSLHSVADIAADMLGDNLYYVTSSGVLFGLGENRYGQLGEHAPWSVMNEFVQIAAGVQNVFAGPNVVAYKDQQSRLWALGSNAHGRLSSELSETAHSNVPILISASEVTDVSLSDTALLYQTADGELYGRGRIGIDAQGNPSSEVTPTAILIEKAVERGLATAEGFIYLKNGELVASGAVSSSTEATEPDLAIRKVMETEVSQLISAHASSLFYQKDQALVTSLSFIEASPSDESWEGFERTIRVRSDQSWIARSEADWIVLDETEGEAGIAELTIRTKRNDQRKPRTGYVSISGKLVQVYQQSAYFVPAEIDIRQKTFPAAGGQVSIAVDTQGVWNTSIDQDWISATPPSGQGSGQTTLTISPHTGSQARDAEVFINAELVRIRQYGIPDQADFEAWLSARFTPGEIAAFGNNPKGADPDKDGFSNEAEWLLGTEPDDFASRLRYSYRVEAGALRIELDRVEPSGVVIRVETAQEPGIWSEAGVVREDTTGAPPQFLIEIGPTGSFARVRPVESD